MKAGALLSSLLTGGGEESCIMDHKAQTYLGCSSCMSLTGRRNMHIQWNRGFSCSLGWGSKFHSFLETLPQVTWKNVELSSQGINQSLGIAFSWYPACSVRACRWDSSEFWTFFTFPDADDWCTEWAWSGMASAMLRAHSVFFLLVQSRLMRTILTVFKSLC